MQSGRHPKKRSRPERTENRQEPARESSSISPDSAEVLARWGFRWTGLAAVLAAVLFFWTWLFLDHVPGRGSTLLMLLRPDDLIAQWLGKTDPSSFGQNSIPPGLFDRWPIVFAAGFIVIASVGPGSLLVGLLLGRGKSEKLEQLVLAIGAGLNLASLWVLAGGMFPGALHDPWWIWLGLLFGLLLLPVAIWRMIAGQNDAPQSDAAATPADEVAAANQLNEITLARWSLLAIAVMSLPYFLGGLLPPWDFDVREYHLQAPKEWMQRGQIDFLPHNVYANMPLGVEIHAVTATAILGAGDEAWWLGGLTAKLLISLYAPLTALLLWCIGRRTGNLVVGTVAAVCYLSLPWIGHVSLGGLNDAVLGFYLLACWWVWWRSEAGDWRPLLLAGFFGGAAAAIKYPALVFVVLPLVIETTLRKLGLRGSARVAWVGPRQLVNAALALVLLAIGGALGGGLWYAKNAQLTGNPVYPLLASRFGGETRTPEKDARWVKAHAVPRDEQGHRFGISQLTSKVRILAIGDKLIIPEGTFASPLLTPLVILGAIYVVQNWWAQPRRKQLLFPLLALALAAFIFVAWFLITHRLDRFLVPALPLLALMAGFGYLFVKEQGGAAIARIFLGVGLLYSVLFLVQFGSAADTRWFVSLAHLRTDPPSGERGANPVLRTSNTVQRISPVERWLQDRLKPDEAVLLVGGARVWDLPGKTQAVNVYYNTCFDDCVLLDWRAGKKPDEVEKFRAEFQSRKVRYVCVDWGELERYLGPGNYGYDRRLTTKDSLRLFNNLENTRLLKVEAKLGAELPFLGQAKRPRQVIYRVLTPAEAAADAAAAAAERARQKAATKNIKPTPKAAPPKSANQSRTSE